MHHLDTALILAVAASVVLWGLFAARLEALNVSSAIVFVVLGFVLANKPVSAIDVHVRSGGLRALAEITLAVLLFSDAARVNLRALRRDAGVTLRLLLLGLPLTIALGTLVAVLLFPDLDVWAAATIAAAVAPTDAALGAQVVSDRNVPMRIRRTLNVESGLNDGIATPFVMFFIAGTVVDTVAHTSESLAGALGELGLGVLVGVGVGLAGGLLITLSTRRGWAAPGARGIGVLAIALVSYSLSVELGGNGFIAAFVGGLAIGSVLPSRDQDEVLEFDAHTGDLLSFIVWFLFGAAIWPVLEETTWRSAVFAVLALTVIRMVPVALVLIGARLRPVTVAFIGWFGPRGLASVVFGLIAFDSLQGEVAVSVLNAVTLTVLLSVLAHGVTARPLSKRYGAHIAALAESIHERAPIPELPARHLPGRRVRPQAITELDD